MISYKILELDVFTDASGEYEKSAIHLSGVIDLKDDYTIEELINALKDRGHLSLSLTKQDITIQNLDCKRKYLELIKTNTGYPLLDLQQV